MPQSVRKLLNLMLLLRIELVLTAVSDSWLVIFLAYSIEPAAFHSEQFDQMSLGLAMLLGGVVAAGLAAYGLALNDVLDARHDRAFSPDRPIPAGEIRLSTALSTAVLALLVALSAALFLGQGSALLAALVAGGILFYNTTARFLPATGIICLALVRMLHMFVPNPQLGFAWPIWLNFTYTVVAASVVYVLVAKRPRLLAHSWWALLAAWTFWTMALLGWMSWRRDELPDAPAIIWVGPITAVMLLILIVLVLIRRIGASPQRRRAAALLFSKIALLWLIVLNASWLLAAGLYRQSLAQLGLFVVALGVSLLLSAHEPQGPARPAYRIHLGMGGRP
jgi:hypothetical protein